MYRYLAYEGTPVRPETLRRFCDNSNDDIEWLEKHGVHFGSRCYEKRIAYPPEGKRTVAGGGKATGNGRSGACVTHGAVSVCQAASFTGAGAVVSMAVIVSFQVLDARRTAEF